MPEGFSRRSFLKLAATAGAAVALPGCEPAARKLVPYVVPDENVIPGVPSFYASTCNECSAGCGIVARVREGRVIKLEGNPLDPIGKGAICARGQAALQGLYNPDRLRAPMVRQGDGTLRQASWDGALKILVSHLKAASAKGSDRVVFLGAPQGPTLGKITAAFTAAYQSDRALYYEPLTNEAAREAAQFCFDRRDLPAYHIDRAEVLISFGADFLETWNSPVELSRQYAEFRAPKKRGANLTIGRAIYVGPRMGLTAANCDEWVAVPAGAQSQVALAVLHAVVEQGWIAPDAAVDTAALKNFVAPYDPDSVAARTGVSAARIRTMGERFGKASGALALAGGADPAAYVAAFMLNAATGNLGRTVEFYQDAPAESASRSADLSAALDSMRDGDVDVVVVAGGNPLYSMPGAWKAAEALGKVPFVAWAGTVPDETAQAAHLLLPSHHALEDWRDTNPRAALHGLGQPVMQPVFNSKPLGDILISAAQQGGATPKVEWKDTADAVKTEWLKLNPALTGPAAEQFWLKSLRDGGLFAEAKPAPAKLGSAALKASLAPSKLPKLALYTYPHIFLYDGRGADKPWLQEMPEPVAQLVWDSWAEIHPDTARRIGVAKDELVEIRSAAGTFQAPVFISERVHPGVIAVPLGQGHAALGRWAKGRGANPFVALKPGELSAEVTAHPTHLTRQLVSPLVDNNMMGRPIVEAMTIEDLARGIEPPTEKPPEPYEMYPKVPYPKHMWGMTIDVNACTGCSACVAACYAENNLTVVGKDRVAQGRIMSWIRIERYYPQKKHAQQEPLMYLEPMLCQQCNHAPCEPVCPVFAAYHTDEGLNGQIYNRCIGTRYCENNCPYKVRRFNWFKPEWPEPLNMQLNPDVTQRGAGVMEKCTFCIQRIEHAEITARIENRPVRDGEIMPACAQACPTRAISFGDMDDKQSAMMRRRADNRQRGYRALEDLNTQPAIVYLRNLYHRREKA
jgi:anaerobic selenocysteine-containing dehydrogenase/Fe-S-cluster-containing dehydrogenase component